MTVLEDVQLFEYRERMHLTYEQLLDEPAEEVERAFLIWSLKRERDKLEAERQKMQQ